MSDYLTTKELAELLRIKERKVYDLAASGTIPCSRAMGKLLFPRLAVEAWIAENSSGPARDRPAGVAAPQPFRPNVFLGSHDPLLEWALREAGAGCATYFDSSLDGLARFANAEGFATGLHLYDAEADDWNASLVEDRFGRQPVVLIEWAWRSRGLVLAPELAGQVHSFADLRGKRIVPRQSSAGSQSLLDDLVAGAAFEAQDIVFIPAVRSETDAALAVLEGKADAAFGLAALARQYRLGFVPLLRERFDILIDRRAYFEPTMQRLLAFARSDGFAARAAELQGYDIRSLGFVRFNGA